MVSLAKMEGRRRSSLQPPGIVPRQRLLAPGSRNAASPRPRARKSTPRAQAKPRRPRTSAAGPETNPCTRALRKRWHWSSTCVCEVQKSYGSLGPALRFHLDVDGDSAAVTCSRIQPQVAQKNENFCEGFAGGGTHTPMTIVGFPRLQKNSCGNRQPWCAALTAQLR